MEDLMLQSDCFGDALRIAQDNLDSKNFYAINPSFDKKMKK
jgi:spore coat protein JC